ncbi:MAG TPA: hypothetical protein ENH88_23030 [Pseudoalteromonas prydzensis]|uniref:Uncharacterized protein n=1 Tax=Pseudoalteromonas prydzensis TaxID=182141 RepID=A0A7V1D3K8_9GAMM|nr:hypothetical protein [Pseudoalteromonas prydzensis]
MVDQRRLGFTPAHFIVGYVAYLVSASAYERLVDEIDDYELAKIVARRREKVSTAVEVNIDDL